MQTDNGLRSVWMLNRLGTCANKAKTLGQGSFSELEFFLIKYFGVALGVALCMGGQDGSSFAACGPGLCPGDPAIRIDVQLLFKITEASEATRQDHRILH